MEDFSISDNDNKDDPEDKPIPFDEDEEINISHISSEPLSLGKSVPEQKPLSAQKIEEGLTSKERITGVKTFFTKLHAGGIDFLDGQIKDWLSKNPRIIVKHTSATTGMVVSKKTEPNLIITIWY